MSDKALIQVADHELATAAPMWPTPASARETMATLQAVMQAVLDESDYATIQRKKWRKRSGFTKLRRAFHISIEELADQWEDLGDGAFGCRVLVRASFPNGRYEDGDGYCDSLELGKGNIAPTRHNVRAKAMTRAKNRATADLLGTGEVSADELTPDAYQEGQIVEHPPRVRQLPKPENGRPLAAERVREVLRKKAGWQEGQRLVEGDPVTDGQQKSVASLMSEAFHDDKARHQALDYLFGVTSTSALYKREASAVIAWLKSAEDGNWDLNEYASQEAANILQQIALDAGQQALPL